MRALGNSLSLDEGNTFGVEGKSLSHELSPDLLATFARAVELSQIPKKVIAYHLGVPDSYFSRMLSGEKQTTFAHVNAAPKALRRIFWRLAAEADGLAVSETDPVAEAAANVQVAMARYQALTTSRLPDRARPIRMDLDAEARQEKAK